MQPANNFIQIFFKCFNWNIENNLQKVIKQSSLVTISWYKNHFIVNVLATEKIWVSWFINYNLWDPNIVDISGALFKLSLSILFCQHEDGARDVYNIWVIEIITYLCWINNLNGDSDVGDNIMLVILWWWPI